MFDLEKSIAEWRRQMLAAGIKTPVPLEELEIHLREEIEQQMKSGLNEQQAFNSAVQKIGQGETLNSEFGKNNQKERSLIIIAGIFAYHGWLLLYCCWHHGCCFGGISWPFTKPCQDGTPLFADSLRTRHLVWKAIVQAIASCRCFSFVAGYDLEFSIQSKNRHATIGTEK